MAGENGGTCSCNGNCDGCQTKSQVIWYDDLPEEHEYIMDESGYPIGVASKIKSQKNISYKYAEDRMISDLKAYIDNTYNEHYMTETQTIECFDAWIALGDSTPTFRNTAIKYLWRYGKKSGNNKKDLMKALHYVMMCLYVDHYKDDK
jgi:hypothetical protein